VLATLVTAGCFRLDVAVEVRPDGSGTAREIFAVDRRRTLEVMPDREGLVDAIPRADRIENLPTWARATPYRQDGFEGVAIDLDFPTPELLGPRLKVLNSAITDTVASPATSDVVLEREGLGWRFTARQSQLSLRPDEARGSEIRDALYATAEIRLTLELPGRIVDHNADQVEGNRLTWTISRDVEDSELFAVSAPLEAGGGNERGRLIAWAIAFASVGGVLVGTALVLYRRPSTAGPAGGPGPRPGAAPSPSAPGREAPAATGRAPRAAPPADWPSTPPPAPPMAPPEEPPPGLRSPPGR
jgi:hypothetical protein